MTQEFLPIIQKLLAIILFLYLAKFISRMSQFYTFINKIKDNIKFDFNEKGEATFAIPLANLISYFGFHYKEKHFLTLITQQKRHGAEAFVFILSIWLSVATLIAYFLLNIPLMLIALAIASLLFLMLIF